MRGSGLLALSLALICLAAGIAGCTTQSNTGPAGVAAADQAEVVRLGGGDYGYPQPFTIYPRGPGSSKVTMIFDSLVEKDEKDLIPWLAENWDVSPDGKEYTFYLRKGVKWHDDTLFTAKDVKFTHDYELDHVPISGGIEAGIIDSVQVIDDHTVKFILKQPTATFLYKLSGSRHAEHIYSTISDRRFRPEAVTGADHTLAEYNKEHGSRTICCKRRFWGPKPAIKVVEFIPVSDAYLV